MLISENLAAALIRLENSRAPQDLQRLIGLLTRWLQAPEQQDLRRAFTVWIKRAPMLVATLACALVWKRLRRKPERSEHLAGQIGGEAVGSNAKQDGQQVKDQSMRQLDSD